MTITQATHKLYLFRLFYVNGQERKFSLTDLAAASSALRNITRGSSLGDEGRTIQFADGDVEFNIDEAKLLKDLFAMVTEASPSEFDVISELRSILV